MKTPSLVEIYGEPISVYTQEQAIADGVLVRVGYLAPTKTPVTFTSNLFGDVKDHYHKIITKGLEMLRQKDEEDTDYMKLRVIEKGKIWVIANDEGMTFMKPEDY